MVVLAMAMLHTKFQGHRCIGSKEEDVLRFYHIWAWRSCLSCDPTHMYNFLFPFSLKLSMLHTKFQGHWSIGSVEEDFVRFLPYIGMAAMLVM